MKRMTTIFLLSCMAVFGQTLTLDDPVFTQTLTLSNPSSWTTLTAELSTAEGASLSELESLVSKMAAQLKQAQAEHEQELRRLGAAKFPGQFGVAGKLEISDGDYSTIRWIPTSPSCRPHRSRYWLSSDNVPAYDEPLVTFGTGSDSLSLWADSLAR